MDASNTLSAHDINGKLAEGRISIKLVVQGWCDTKASKPCSVQSGNQYMSRQGLVIPTACSTVCRSCLFDGFAECVVVGTHTVFSKRGESSSDGHKDELAFGKRKASVVYALAKGLF